MADQTPKAKGSFRKVIVDRFGMIHVFSSWDSYVRFLEQREKVKYA